MPAPNYQQIPIIMYLSDVTKQMKKKANCANKDGGIGFLQIMFKDTSNKLLKLKLD